MSNENSIRPVLPRGLITGLAAHLQRALWPNRIVQRLTWTFTERKCLIEGKSLQFKWNNFQLQRRHPVRNVSLAENLNTRSEGVCTGKPTKSHTSCLPSKTKWKKSTKVFILLIVSEVCVSSSNPIYFDVISCEI